MNQLQVGKAKLSIKDDWVNLCTIYQEKLWPVGPK
jgi:hypothetical protein